MPRKKDQNSLTQSYASFLRAHPEPLGDPGKLFAYMLFACPPNAAGVRFCYAGDTTMLKAMGWRSLDQVDAAVKHLQERRFMSDRVTANRSVGDEMEGYYLYPKGDAPAPPPTAPSALFGEAVMGADAGEQEEEPAEQPDSLEAVYAALRRLTARVEGVLHLDDFKNLVRTDPAVLHVPPDEIEWRIERELKPGSWNIRMFGDDAFVVAPQYVGEDFMTTYEFQKLAGSSLRRRPRA